MTVLPATTAVMRGCAEFDVRPAPVPPITVTDEDWPHRRLAIAEGDAASGGRVAVPAAMVTAKMAVAPRLSVTMTLVPAGQGGEVKPAVTENLPPEVLTEVGDTPSPAE